MDDLIDEDWIKYTEVNNFTYEIVDFGKVKTLVFKDFLKYPDKLKNLTNKLKIDSDDMSLYSFKPGKTYGFHPSLINVYLNCISESIKKIFLFNEVYSVFGAINYFNGNMQSHFNYPHTDAGFPRIDTTIAANIGLTKNLKGGTGFWSYRNKVNMLDFTSDDIESYKLFIKDQKKISHEKMKNLKEKYEEYKENRAYKWHQIENEGDWKLECICPLEYNSLVLYSTLNFHNPYIKPEWYCDEDRTSVSGFFDIELKTQYDNELNDLWKIFRLNEVYEINSKL